MKRSRQYRRFQREKNIKRFFNKDTYFPRDSEIRKERSIKFGDTPKSNKCQCCCNPRRSKLVKEKRTLQERRIDNDLKEFDTDT